MEVGVMAVSAGAVAILIAAGFVLFLDAQQRVHRAFALLLLVWALQAGLLAFRPTFDNLPGRLRVYLYIALPFAALYFANVYRASHRPAPQSRPRWLSWAVPAVLCVIVEAAYVVNHDWYGWPGEPGLLFVFGFLPFPTLALVGLAFALDFNASQRVHQRRALAVTAVGFCLVAVYFSLFDLFLTVVVAVQQPEVLRTRLVVGSIVADVATLAAAALVFGIILRRLLHEKMPVKRYIATWSAAAFTGLLVAALHLVLPSGVLDLPFHIGLALWTFALPVCVTYALVRHRLFDAEIRLRFAIKGTTLTALFVGTFFVVAKLTESWAQEVFNQNWIVGAIAAGLLLFAISPLQGLAERLAQRAVPGGRSMSHLPKVDRLRIYEEQLEVAWQDGQLTAKERLLFARLQERLALTAAEAHGLEARVLETVTRRLPKSRRPAAA